MSDLVWFVSIQELIISIFDNFQLRTIRDIKLKCCLSKCEKLNETNGLNRG